MGPLGGLGGVGVDVDECGFTSSPPLGKSRPRLGVVFISMIWREVRHIECVAHEVLGLWDVDDVCVVVDALEDLET